MVVGNIDHQWFQYRSSFYITRFFEECELEYAHDGSSRVPWTEGVLAELLADAHPSTHQLPERFATVLRTLIVGACNRSGVCSPTALFPAHAICHWRVAPCSN